MSLSVENLEQGIRYRKKTGWDKDFHNGFYQWLETHNAQKNANGDFNYDWWVCFLRSLHTWRATRMPKTINWNNKIRQQRNSLADAWKKNIVPNIKKDIAQVEWSQIEEFCNIVKKIKGVGSPVFTSKFCHFLAPQIFPVIDNKVMGNPFRSYQDYYEHGREDWKETPRSERMAMEKLLKEEIKKIIDADTPKGKLYRKYPFKTKIIELCYIGKNNVG